MENELFEKTKVSKAYMTLALPVVLGMVVSLIYNMVDTFFIARTGNTALIAGVSLGTPIFTLMIALGDIFGVGAVPSFRASSVKKSTRTEDGSAYSAFTQRLLSALRSASSCLPPNSRSLACLAVMRRRGSMRGTITSGLHSAHRLSSCS